MNASTFVETLELERLFNAPVETVFNAWEQADIIALWFGPDGFKVIKSEANCKPGGKYNITLVSPDNDVIKHFGEYLEVDKPKKLIFTWILENQACSGSDGQHANTIVEITFTPQGNQTLLKLRHERLPDKNSLDGHHFGWQNSFISLETFLKNSNGFL